MTKQIIHTPKAPEAIGPYSQAVLANGTLYISGQIGHILEAAGLGYQDVVKCGIFLKDMNDFVQVNEVYGSYFPSDPPARETVEVARLPKDVNVEISVIAVR
jgi:2-iminobutanoate/2-iminopropanoate deaminase